jgi:uroporphyrinogen-III synthase
MRYSGGDTVRPSPLTGKRIVNTRAAHQAQRLDNLLSEVGALPIPYPCLSIAPPEDSRSLDTALQQLACGYFDWLLLTSSNTVMAIQSRLEDLGLTISNMPTRHVAAVGPATADAAQRMLNLEVTLVPEEYVAESLAEAVVSAGSGRILLPQSDLARPVLTESLVKEGIDVTSIVAYRTLPGSGGAPLPKMLAEKKVDAITFTSPSTVHNLLRRLHDEHGDASLLSQVCLACIGPITAKAVLSVGFTPQVVAAEHTLAGLVAGVEDYFRRYPTYD